MLGGAMDVGAIRATLGAELHDQAFHEFDRRVDAAERRARNPIDQKLGAKPDLSGFDAYDRRLRNVDDSHERLIRGSGRVRTAMGGLFIGGAGVAAGAVAFTALARGATAAVDAFEESEKTGRRQSLVIRTMGQDAGAAAKHVDELAAAQMRKTGIDDDTIIAGANVVRTFKNIKNEGDGVNAIFDRTVKASLDLSSAFGTDLQSASIQLGKALDNPAKGAASLSRTGAIAKDDVEKLKKMAEDGVPILEQQKFVLEAVEKQVQGTAASNATATDKIRASWGEFLEWAGEKIAPTFNAGLNAVRGFIDNIVSGGADLGGVVDIIGARFELARDIVVGVFKWVRGAIEDLAHDQGFRSFVDNVIDLIGRLQQFIRDAFNYIADAIKSVKPELETIGRAILAVVDKVVDVARKMLPGVKQAFEGFVDVVKGFVKIVAGILKLDFGKVWEGIKDIVGGALDVVVGLVKAIAQPFRAAFGAIFSGLGKVAGAVWDGITGVVKKGLDGILGAVTTMMGGLSSAFRVLGNLPIIGGAFDKVADGIDGARRSIDDFRESLRETDRQTGRNDDSLLSLGDRVDRLKNRLSNLKKGTDDYRRVARQLHETQDDLNDKLRETLGAGQRAARGIGSVSGGAYSASGAVASAATAIAANVDQLARKLGAQGITFTPARTPSARRTQNNVFNDLPDFSELAQGGTLHGHLYVGAKGQRGRDDRILLGADGRPEAAVGAGELLVFNGDQIAALEQAVAMAYRTNLDGFFAAGWRDHRNTPMYAQGGVIPDWYLAGPAGGYKRDGDAALRRLDQAAEKKAASFPMLKMISFAKAEAAKGYPYVYGGGHGGFHGPYDCSGYVSSILHAGGLLGGGPITTDGLKVWGRSGDGPITVGVRGSSGRNAHTMIRLGDLFFESGSGHGARQVGGWSGTFPIHRTMGFQKGGRVDSSAFVHLPERIRRMLVADPSLIVPEVVGFGLASGGKLPAFAKGGMFRKAHKLAGAGGHDAGQAEGWVRGWEQKISDAERRYGQKDRLYGLSEEELIVEDETGAHVDMPALLKRGGEVNGLIAMRKSILEYIRDYRKAAAKAIAEYQDAIKRLTAAIAAVPSVSLKGKKGKALTAAKRSRAEAQKLRQGYRDQLDSYQGRVGELKGLHHDLGFDLQDSRIDLVELGNERKALGLGGLQAEAAGMADTGSGSDTGGLTAADPVTAAPSASDVAAAAHAQFQAFQDARADLFRGFGANAVAAPDLAKAVADGIGQAAGMRYFGASSEGAGGGTTIHQTVNIGGTSTDELTFAQRSAGELRAALS